MADENLNTTDEVKYIDTIKIGSENYPIKDSNAWHKGDIINNIVVPYPDGINMEYNENGETFKFAKYYKDGSGDDAKKILQIGENEDTKAVDIIKFTDKIDADKDIEVKYSYQEGEEELISENVLVGERLGKLRDIKAYDKGDETPTGTAPYNYYNIDRTLILGFGQTLKARSKVNESGETPGNSRTIVGWDSIPDEAENEEINYEQKYFFAKGAEYNNIEIGNDYSDESRISSGKILLNANTVIPKKLTDRGEKLKNRAGNEINKAGEIILTAPGGITFNGKIKPVTSGNITFTKGTYTEILIPDEANINYYLLSLNDGEYLILTSRKENSKINILINKKGNELGWQYDIDYVQSGKIKLTVANQLSCSYKWIPLPF